MQEQSHLPIKFDIPLDFFAMGIQPVIMMMKESWNLQMLFCQMIFIFPCTVRRNCFMYGDIVMKFDQNDNWDHMEKLLDKVAFKDDVWYATNGQIQSYVDAYRKLTFFQ